MHDIFLSYSTQDRERLTPLFYALEQQGWSVFWDHQSIHIGEHWHRKIDEAIRTSRCVVVVWSKHSLESEWVLEEASAGKSRDVLLPVKIDDVSPPFGFAMRQAGNFIGWDGTTRHPAFLELAEDIRSLFALEAKKKREVELKRQEEEARQARIKQQQEEDAKYQAEIRREENVKRETEAAITAEEERLARGKAAAEQKASEKLELQRRLEEETRRRSESTLDASGYITVPQQSQKSRMSLVLMGIAAVAVGGTTVYVQQKSNSHETPTTAVSLASVQPAAIPESKVAKDYGSTVKIKPDTELKPKDILPAGVVATVNGIPVTKTTLDTTISMVRGSSADAKFDTNAVLDDLIITEIARQEANKSGMADRSDIKQKLKDISDKLVLNAWMQDKAASFKITDEELKAAYDKQVSAGDKYEYHARHILMKTKEEAQGIINELDNKGDFAELAKKSSDGPSAATGGDLGWFKLATMVKPFAEAVAKMEPGTITKEPVQTEFGFHVIKLEERREVKSPEFDAVKPQLQRQLEQEKMLKYMEELRAKADVKIVFMENPLSNSIPFEQTVAIVNGQNITKSALDTVTGIARGSSSDAKVDTKAMLDDLIVTEIARQEANKSGLADRADIKQKLQDITDKLVLNAWTQDKAASFKITDEELKAAYDKQVSAGDKYEYHARHILMKTKEEAQGIINELDNKGDFAELAKKSSDGSSAATGGDLGWFKLATMVKPFAEAVAKMEPGTITKEPVQTEFGFHIIKLEERREVKPPEAVKSQLRHQLEQEKMLKYMEELRAKAEVKVLLPE
jgi:peptidyl-prolyl cis-trans isomerase C